MFRVTDQGGALRDESTAARESNTEATKLREVDYQFKPQRSALRIRNNEASLKTSFSHKKVAG